MPAYIHSFLYTSLKTDSEPDVNVSVYNGVVDTENSLEYSVLEGQVFGVECRTQPYFSVHWKGTSEMEGW